MSFIYNNYETKLTHTFEHTTLKSMVAGDPSTDLLRPVTGPVWGVWDDYSICWVGETARSILYKLSHSLHIHRRGLCDLLQLTAHRD